MKRLPLLMAGPALVLACFLLWKSLPVSPPATSVAVPAGSRAPAAGPRPASRAPLDIIRDRSRTLEERAASARTILTEGQPEEVTRLLAWLCARAAEQEPVPDDIQSLMAELANPLSPAALGVCLQVLLDQTGALPDWDLLPPAFADSLTKGLRGQLPASNLDTQLLSAWQGVESPAIRRRLESLEVPGLLSGLAVGQIAAGSEDRWTTLARLETCPHPDTAAAILSLASLPHAPVSELGNMLYNWSAANLRAEQAATLSATLSDPSFTEVQRGLAALALAAAGDRTDPVPALTKALENQPNGWLRDRLDQALLLAREFPDTAAATENP